MLINHFEEKFFESQLRFTIKFNISSQNVLLELIYNILKVLQFNMKFKAFIRALTLVYYEIFSIFENKNELNN
jgi:hypothetical protein